MRCGKCNMNRRMGSKKLVDSLVAPMSAEDKEAEAGPKRGPPVAVQPLRSRRDYGAVASRVARQMTSSDNAIYYIIDQSELAKLQDKTDEQTYDLAIEVYKQLAKDLAFSPGQHEALSRLMASMHSGWSSDMHRNNIFKAAHALGMKLPSSMF